MSSGCQRCEANSPGARRRRCPGCKFLVGKCCWDVYEGECSVCADPDSPEDPGDLDAHLTRIQARRDVLDQSIEMYERACSAFWEGEYTIEKLATWGVGFGQGRPPSVDEAFRAYARAIAQACAGRGLFEDMWTPPTIEFPGFAAGGGVEYAPGDIEALTAGLNRVREVVR